MFYDLWIDARYLLDFAEAAPNITQTSDFSGVRSRDTHLADNIKNSLMDMMRSLIWNLYGLCYLNHLWFVIFQFHSVEV